MPLITFWTSYWWTSLEKELVFRCYDIAWNDLCSSSMLLSLACSRANLIIIGVASRMKDNISCLYDYRCFYSKWFLFDIFCFYFRLEFFSGTINLWMPLGYLSDQQQYMRLLTLHIVDISFVVSNCIKRKVTFKIMFQNNCKKYFLNCVTENVNFRFFFSILMSIKDCVCI